MENEPLYFIFQDRIVELFLQYNVIIIGACVFGFLLLQFIEEYFPKKARVYDLSSALLTLTLRKKWRISQSLKK